MTTQMLVMYSIKLKMEFESNDMTTQTLVMYSIKLKMEFESSDVREVLARQNFQIPCFIFFNYLLLVGCLHLVSWSIGIYVRVSMDRSFDKSGGGGESSNNWQYSNAIFFSLIVVITPNLWAKVVFVLSVSIHHLAYWSLYHFFFSFCHKWSKQAQTRCRVCWNATLLIIHSLLLLLTIFEVFLLLQEISSTLFQWRGCCNWSFLIVWEIPFKQWYVWTASQTTMGK